MSIDDLKLRIKDTPINHIIGAYIPVEKKGSNFVAQCPFHDDNDPSLQINPTRNMFKCFVDDIGGDAITFVMEFKKIDFIDALRDICQSMGWNFDDYDDKKPQSPKDEMAKKILNKVTLLYQKSAEQSPVFAQFKLDRGLSDEIVKEYQLGFAPAHNAVTSYLNSIKDEKDRSFALKIAQEIGLIREDRYREGSHYDTFRERIVFPIWDHFGHVHGYTTRATRDDQKAKYMNSPESFAFHKKNILYGLHLAKPAIKERDLVLLCEGNMDQIALYKSGFENNVAVMGTALGEASLQRLVGLTKNVVLALDTDDAGRRAAERMNAQLLDLGVVSRFLEFTPHKDPDDFLKAEGRLALARKLEESKPLIDSELDELIPEKIPETPEAKMAILEKGFEILAPLKESLSATERIAALAKRLGIRTESSQIFKSYTTFLESYKKRRVIRPQAPQQPAELDQAPKDRQFLSSSSDKNTEARTPKAKAIGRAEKRLIQEMVRHPECLVQDKMMGLLDFVETDEVKKYVLRLKNLVYEVDENEFSKFATQELDAPDYSLELRQIVGSTVFDQKTFGPLNEKVIERMLADIRRKLEGDQLKSKRDDLKKQQEECTTLEQQQHFSDQIAELNKQINNLRKT